MNKLNILKRIKFLSSKFTKDKLKFEKDAEIYYNSLSNINKLKVFFHIIKVIHRNKIKLKIDEIDSIIYDLCISKKEGLNIYDSGILEISNALDFNNNFEYLLQESINRLTLKHKNNYDIMLAQNLLKKMKEIHTEELMKKYEKNGEK